jgi:WD40 repeat protein
MPIRYKVEVATHPDGWRTVATSADHRTFVHGGLPVTDKAELELPAASGPDVEAALAFEHFLPRGEIDAHPAGVVAIDFGPDGRHLATAGRDGTVRVWTRADDGAFGPSAVFTLSKLPSRVASVAFSPDGSYLLAAASDGTLRVLRPAGQCPRLLVHCGRSRLEVDLQVEGFGCELVSGVRWDGWPGPYTHAWYDTRKVVLRVVTPEGTTGTLRLFTVDPDGLGRKQTVTVEGSELGAYALNPQGEWIEALISADDTADGEVLVELTNDNEDLNAVVSIIEFIEGP